MLFQYNIKNIIITAHVALLLTGFIASNTSANITTESLDTNNQTPIANNDVASTTLNKAVSISVLENDSDPDNDTIDIIRYTNPAHGLVEQQEQTLLYTPNQNFIGSDSFSYTISDGEFTETTAIASSTAIAVFSPEGDFVDTDTFTFTLSDSEDGTATANANGTATIFRNTEDSENNTNTTETITFTIFNTEDGEAMATATATAMAETEDAIATATATATAIRTPFEEIIDSETFTFTLATNNSDANATAESTAEIVYTPNANHFSYTLLDPNGTEITATTIAIAMATASATINAMTTDTATVKIAVNAEKPTFTLANTNYITTSTVGKIQVPAWITQATDGVGGTQLPQGGNNQQPIYFYVTSNSNPALFSQQPWLSYPSHSLHFTTKTDTDGSAEICMQAVTQKGQGEASNTQCFTIILAVAEITNAETPESVILEARCD